MTFLNRYKKNTSVIVWLTRAGLLLAMLVGIQSTVAQTVDRPALEMQVKAAYLYKFGSYVEWPGNAFTSVDSPLTIGVIGADALADELTQMVANRTIKGRQIIVRKLRREDGLTGINVLFIGSANEGGLPEILARVKGQPVLLVTESERALPSGSMINFVLVNGKIRFEIAAGTAQLENLNISARLLSAAYKVVLEPS